MFLSIETYLLPCAFKQLLGIDCPVCGFQRSLLLMASGNFKDSFLMYPPLIPVLLLAGVAGVHFLNRQLVKRKLLLQFSTLVLIIVMCNYVARLIFGPMIADA